MENSEFNEILRKYRGEAAAAGKLGALSDSALECVAGGLGGADEATCPKCGKPMVLSGQEYGDGIWTCSKCEVKQLLSDAETIEMIRYMEQIGYPNIEYPVWWELIKK